MLIWQQCQDVIKDAIAGTSPFNGMVAKDEHMTSTFHDLSNLLLAASELSCLFCLPVSFFSSLQIRTSQNARQSKYFLRTWYRSREYIYISLLSPSLHLALLDSLLSVLHYFYSSSVTSHSSTVLFAVKPVSVFIFFASSILLAHIALV